MLKYGLPMAPAPVVVVMVAGGSGRRGASVSIGHGLPKQRVQPGLLFGRKWLVPSSVICSSFPIGLASKMDRTCKMACLAACQGWLMPGSCMRMLLSIDTHAQISRAFHLLTLFKSMP